MQWRLQAFVHWYLKPYPVSHSEADSVKILQSSCKFLFNAVNKIKSPKISRSTWRFWKSHWLFYWPAAFDIVPNIQTLQYMNIFKYLTDACKNLKTKICKNVEKSRCRSENALVLHDWRLFFLSISACSFTTLMLFFILRFIQIIKILQGHFSLWVFKAISNFHSHMFPLGIS